MHQCYRVRVVTCAAVAFFCRKWCAVGKSMIYHSYRMNQLFVALIFLALCKGTHAFETYSFKNRKSCGWVPNSLAHTDERTVEEKSRAEKNAYKRVEKNIELKSRTDQRGIEQRREK